MDWFTVLILVVYGGGLLMYVAFKRQKVLDYNKDENSTKKFIIGLFSITLLIAIVFTASIYPNYRNLIDIKQHGFRSTADVVSVREECSKRTCVHVIGYRYEAPGRLGKVYSLTSEDKVKNADMGYIPRYRKVPIAVASDHPDRSSINFGDVALTTAPSEFLRFFYFLIPIVSVFGGLLAAIAISGMSLRRSSY